MSIKVSRILHAGYVFEHGDTSLVFDPIFENPFSKNCYAFPDVEFDREQIKKLKFSAIFISHFHDDHCSFESLDLLDRKTPIYIYCIYEKLFSLVKALGFKKVYPLRINSPVVIGAFEITPRRALDADVDSIFQIQAGDLKILNIVDSWIDDSTLQQLAAKGPWDLILWPFQTMREIEVIAPSRAQDAARTLPPEWIEQMKALNPRYVVPSSCQFRAESWSWYNQAFFPISYRQFQKEIALELPGTGVVRMNPSVSMSLDQASFTSGLPLSWIRPVGEQDVDYTFDAQKPISSTAKISQNFLALTLEQSEKVYEYCQQGLIEKYRSMDPPEEPYFAKTRIWRLSVFDHQGSSRNYFYQITSNKIELLPNEKSPISWATEIPIAKFYAAIELGESLTSMYMRVNDTVFASDIEAEVHGADIVDDPLIRCLFTGVFGAYQVSQLKRLGLDL